MCGCFRSGFRVTKKTRVYTISLYRLSVEVSDILYQSLVVSSSLYRSCVASLKTTGSIPRNSSFTITQVRLLHVS